MKNQLLNNLSCQRASLCPPSSVQFREDVSAGLTKLQQKTNRSRQGIVNDLLLAALWQAERDGLI